MQNRTVLVVDDEPCVASLLADVLKASDAKVVKRRNGLPAVDTLRSDQFDLIFLDVSAYDRHGWEVLEYIRRQQPALWARTIIMTADRFHSETHRRILDLKRPTVFKPFRLPELRATAHRVLLAADGAEATKAAAA